MSEEKKLYGGMTRRTLCYGVGGAAIALGLGTLKFVPETAVVRPPGGQDEDAFMAGCNRCERCVEACPMDAIKLCHVEDGILNIRTPQMNFKSSYCDFCAEANNGTPLCAQACYTGALSLPEDATAENTIIGIAVLEEDWCLAYNGLGCRTCYDICPYEAMALDDEEIPRPYVLNDICNGCGACESVCISMTAGSRELNADATSVAITVRALSTIEA